MDQITTTSFFFLFSSICVSFTPSWCQPVGSPPPPPLKYYTGHGGQNPIVKRIQFVVLLRPQGDECFYEEGSVGAHHSVYYQVLDKDAKVIFSTRGPKGSSSARDTKVKGHHTSILEEDGEYIYCFMNLNRRQLKLEFMLTVIDKKVEQKLYHESLDVPKEYQETWNTTLDLVTNVDHMIKYMFENRRQFHYDRQLVANNGKFVTYWSFAQCCVIILASVIQVYVFRTMFRTVSVTPTNKPRS